jgi:hypothetical protein
MSRRSPFVVELSEQDRRRLDSLVRQRTAEQRMVTRARIVLAAAEGEAERQHRRTLGGGVEHGDQVAETVLRGGDGRPR